MATLTSTITKYEYSVETPLNREPPVDELISRFITEDGNFDRNHGPIPHIDPTTHTLSITATDPSFLTTPLQLSADDLRSRFRQHEIVAVLQCAGNRRHTMRTQLREVKGVDWLDGAAMCCVWRGPLLRDVLLAAGAAPPPPSHDDGDGDGLERVDSVVDGAGGGLHVQFASHAARCQEDAWYGASIPLARAMRPEDEVVVAVEMNGAPLKARHGAPVRLVVPGCAGARSVKWVDTIVVQPYESTNHYQQRDYKVLPPECCDQDAAEKWWSRVLALMDMPVNSVVGAPASGSRVSLSHNGTVEVMGYAVPGGGNGPVRRVEVSADEGATWVEAEILAPPEEVRKKGLGLKWAWSLWRARVKVEKGQGKRVWSRATDESDTQPRYPAWNWRGLAYNGYGEAADLIIE